MSTNEESDEEKKALIRKGLDYLQRFYDEDTGKVSITKMHEALSCAEQRIAALEAERDAAVARAERWKAAAEAFWRGSELLGIGPLQAAAIYGPDFDLDGETNAAFIEARRLTALARGEKP